MADKSCAHEKFAYSIEFGFDPKLSRRQSE